MAQIITFQTIKGKQGIRDAARVPGFPGERRRPPLQDVPGGDHGARRADREGAPALARARDAYEREPEAREIVDTARALEGLRREDSVHAAGVVIGDAPLVTYLPLKLSKDSRDDSRRIVTQFDMHGVGGTRPAQDGFPRPADAVGDRDTLSHLRRTEVELDIDHVPLDDADTYAMLCRADTTGVFQLEGGGMRSLIKQLARTGSRT